jgi:acyl-CoA synthetase (AMP-forming)/AMP-acid ligase II
MGLVLGEVSRRNAAVVPDKAAYVLRDVDGSREVVTYGELDERANRFASALADRGVQRGDRVAMLMLNNVAWPVAFFGALKLGAVVVPVNARYRVDEAAATLGSCRPTVLVHEPEYDEFLPVLRERVPSIRTWISVGDRVPRGSEPWADVLASGRPEEPGYPVSEDDPHVIFYTSGTTGAPKGAILTHRAYYLQTAQAIMSARGSGDDDIGLCMFPFFHMSGWANCLPFWRARSTVVIVRRAAPELLARCIDEEQVTQFYAIPEIFRAMCALETLPKFDLSSLCELNSGTSAMSREDVELVCERFGLDGVRVHYGASESGPCTVLPAGQSRIRPSSIGKPQPNVDVKLVDGDGNEVAPGEVGEIAVRSDYLMSGYFEAPDETAKALRDGWYHAGDLATADEEGFLFVCGRLKEVIRSGGESIFPQELERTIVELAGVAECAVVGVADPDWGEAALAAVVLEPGATVDAVAVVEHCGRRLAAYKKPRHVMFVDELPKAGATQKVQKSLVRQRFEERAGP